MSFVCGRTLLPAAVDLGSVVGIDPQIYLPIPAFGGQECPPYTSTKGYLCTSRYALAVAYNSSGSSTGSLNGHDCT